LVQEEGKKGVCSTVYLKQVLEPIVFLYYNFLTEEQQKEFIFIEDGSKVYKGKVCLPKLEKEIRGFDWPPSSLDLIQLKRYRDR
jgi:hypothetical protein